MKSIIEIIDVRGGFDRLANNPIGLESRGFMPLHIERIGTGPRGWPMVAVHHTYEQNGDLMFDPEVTFEVTTAGEWLPVCFEMSGVCYRPAVTRGDNGTVRIDQREVRDLQAFCAMWDRNLRAQGFVDAARVQIV